MKLRTRLLPALLATCASAPLFAQTSSVTLFGIVDMGFLHDSGNAAGTNNKLNSGIMSGSRFGLMGSEDLGGGNKAIFMLEGGVNVDNGSSAQGGTLFGRQAWVGLEGSLGRLTLGRQYTTVAMAQVEFDPFSTGMTGTSASLISAGGQGGSNRANNVAKYYLGHASGFNGELSYAPGEVAGSSSTNSQLGASVGYTRGPFGMKIAYAKANDAVAPGKDAKMTFIGAKYDFGVATAFVNYVINRGSIVPGTVNDKSEDLLLGARIPAGARGRVIVSFINKNDRTADNHDARLYAIGYVYDLSKRTSLYTSYTYIDNKASNTSPTGFYKVWNANDVGNALAGNQAFAIGINHRF
ncbi:MAG: porin [Pigmentiphaga sp.]|uniref:Porin n=1 Tax=Pigmentiphaga daeguensis TaxID=414049 RepID=A0ABP3MZP6_9BURK